MENKEKFKKVSIVLPTYNGARYIKQAINNCLEQTHTNLELIIVDDGSYDETEDIVKSYSDPRIKYFKHKKNFGLAQALNTGFANSIGEYLTWTSDDNFYVSDAITVMLKALEKKSKIDFVYTNFYTIDESGKTIKRVKVPSSRILNRDNCIGPCFLYRRIVYNRLGEFDPSFSLAEDYEYWLRVKSQFRIQKLDRFLCYYRLHKDGLTFRHEKAEVEEQTGKASSKYISSSSIKYYHKGRLFFYKKDYNRSKKELIKSLVHNPFNLDVWKLLVFVCLTTLSPSIAKRIKEIRD